MLALRVDVKRGTVEIDPDTAPEAIATSGPEARYERMREKRFLEAQQDIEDAFARLEQGPDFDREQGASERDLATAAGLSRSRSPFKTGLRALVAQRVLEQSNRGGWRRRP